MGKKKKVKLGIIELHPIEPMITVNYAMQIEYVDDAGNSHLTEKQYSHKKIKIKRFNPKSNVAKVAKGIIDQCKYVPASKQEHIISLLNQLKQRLIKTETSQKQQDENNDNNAEVGDNEQLKQLQIKLDSEINLRLEKEKQLKQERIRTNQEKLRKEKENDQKQQEQQLKKEKEEKTQEEEQKKLEKKEKKKMKKLMKQQLKIEKEMEKNMPKEKGNINKLDKYIENLYENDAKIKIFATYHILQLVQEPDYLSQFVDNKVLIGALGRMLQEDRKKNNELVSNILEIFFCFSNFSELHPILINSKIGATTMQIISHENKRYELTMNERKNADNLDDTEMKFILFLHRQEKLLYICFYVLLNLAEDLEIETKMVQLGIVKYIIRTLQRRNMIRTWLDELIILLLTFSKKLSLFAKNKNKFVDLGIINILYNIISNDIDCASAKTESRESADIQLSVIRLLFNLSFDTKCKQQICECGLLGWLVRCLHMEHTQEFAVKCLYNLSIVDEFKSQICYTDAVVIIIEMIIHFEDRLIPSEIIALAINMSTCEAAIDVICNADNNEYLSLLIKRVHRTFDPLLMKLIHNLSCSLNEDIKIKFKRHLHQLLGMAKTCQQRQEFLVEVLGTISNLSYLGTTEIVAYEELIIQYNLLDFFTKLLSNALIEDDLLLSIIMAIGCFASNSKACALFAEPRLLRVLMQHIFDKLYDEEIALQSIYTIFKLLLHQDSREYICRESQFINIIQQLSADKNKQIKMFAQLCLDVIADYGDEWIQSIKEKRFEKHNHDWIQFIQSLAEETHITDMRPLSPTELTSLHRTNNGNNNNANYDDEDDDYMDDMQLENMFLISDDEEDDDEHNDIENNGSIHNMQRLSIY